MRCRLAERKLRKRQELADEIHAYRKILEDLGRSE